MSVTPPEGDGAPAGAHEIHLLEDDETIPPRPEEEAADAVRGEDA